MARDGYILSIMIDLENLIEDLSSHFATREDIDFAYLYGSWAKGRSNQDSDIDIAVYFYSADGVL